VCGGLSPGLAKCRQVRPRSGHGNGVGIGHCQESSDYLRSGNQSRDQLGATVARDADLPTIDGNLVVLANDRAKYIERRRKSLTAARRKAIRSAFFGGMTYPEIAARNNVPLSTVKS